MHKTAHTIHLQPWQQPVTAVAANALVNKRAAVLQQTPRLRAAKQAQQAPGRGPKQVASSKKFSIAY